MNIQNRQIITLYDSSKFLAVPQAFSDVKRRQTGREDVWRWR